MKQSNVCKICTSWLNLKIVNNIEWLYCDQNHYERVIKTIVTLLPEAPTHEESAELYRRKKDE